jgi:hypothetical protein
LDAGPSFAYDRSGLLIHKTGLSAFTARRQLVVRFDRCLLKLHIVRVVRFDRCLLKLYIVRVVSLLYPSDVEASVNAIEHNKTYDKDVYILNKDIKELNT